MLLTKVNNHIIKRVLYGGLLIVFSSQVFSQTKTQKIEFVHQEYYQNNQAVRLAIQDFQLQTLQLNEVLTLSKINVFQVILPELTDSSRFTKELEKQYDFSKGYQELSFADHAYTWSVNKVKDTLVCILSCRSDIGISHGLYGFLHDALGVYFIHPKQTIYHKPLSVQKLLQSDFSSQPRFRIKGFHLHTQHPLELTEHLLVPSDSSLKEVKRYIDWLARNRQNYFEFSLLESINAKRWPHYAKKIVAYAHQRGILVGIDISLHMIQQKAYMLYKSFPASLRKKDKQIKRHIDRLAAIGFNLYNIEFSTTEFTEGNTTKKQKKMLWIADYISSTYNAKVMSRKHVVKKENMLSNTHRTNYLEPGHKKIEQNIGSMVHTVMSYGLKDSIAPNYGSKNLTHMYDVLSHKLTERETWYYPESAYWITFDNSIPNYFSQYLSRRHRDILLTDSLGVNGHLTFTSGWEFSHWMFDWAIANWSWTTHKKSSFLDPIEKVYRNNQITRLFDSVHQLQEEYLIKKGLIRYITAAQPTDELFGRFNIEFVPRPKHTYKHMLRKYNAAQRDSLRLHVALPLFEYSKQLKDLAYKIEDQKVSEQIVQLKKELVLALQLTAQRAAHKANTLQYIASYSKKKKAVHYLDSAKKIREKSLRYVQALEGLYRYDVEQLARRKKSATAYKFGYLFPVSNLHFWAREEWQLKRNNFNPLRKNIWNIPRIVGLIN